MKYKAEDVGNLLNTAVRLLEITEGRLEESLKDVRTVRNELKELAVLAFLQKPIPPLPQEGVADTWVEIESKAKKRKAKKR